jgi:hypothetical protein
MSRKTVAFGAKPQPQQPAITADSWVSGQQQPAQQEEQGEPMKRLTIDVPASLHRRIKVQCAARDTKIADEVRALLEAHFPQEEQPASGHKSVES